MKRDARSLAGTILIAAISAGAALTASCDLFSSGLGGKVDMDPPNLTIASPSQNAYVSGAVIVSGTASDDLGVKSVSARATVDGRSIVREASLSENGSWSVSFPAYADDAVNGIPDGEQRIEVTATDDKGRTTANSVVVFMDTVGPTVVVTVPSSYGAGDDQFVVSDSITVKGECWDSSPFSKVELSLLDESGATLFTKNADGTASWSAKISFGDGKDIVLEDGAYRFVVRAYDRAGNPSERFFHIQDVWAALSSGTATSEADIDTIGKADQLGASFPGTWSAVESSAFESFPFIVNNQLPEVSISSPDPASATPDLFGGDAMTAGGVAVPSLGARIVKVYWAIKSLDAEPDAAAPEDDASWTAANLSQIGDVLNWDAAIALKDRAEGSYRVFAKALDAGGVYSEIAHADLYYDKSAPSLSLPALSQTISYAKANIPLAWTVSDTNGLVSFTIDSYEVVNGARDESTVTTLLNRTDIAALPAGQAVSDTLVVDTAAISTAVRLYEATATDKAGRTTTLSGKYVIDRAAPQITKNEPTPSLDANGSSLGLRRVNGTVTFKGYIADDNEIKQLYVSVGDNDFTAAELQPSAYSYTKAVDTTAYADKASLTVYLKAVDICGNVATDSVSVYVDQASDLPVVTLLSIDAANAPASAAPADIAAAAKLNRLDSTSLVLQLEDDDGIAAGALKLSFDDGATWTTLTTTQQASVPSGVERAATYVLTGAAQASEGAAKKLLVSVADVNGKTSTSFTGSDDALYPAAYYWVDLSAPAIDFSTVDGISYDGGTQYRQVSFTLAGPVSDASALYSVKYSLDGTNWLAVDSFTNGGSWQKTFTEPVTGLYLRAEDEFAKTTTTVRIPVSVLYDTTAPAISIGVPLSLADTDAAYWKRGTVALSGTATDAVAGIASVQAAITALGGSPAAGDWQSVSFGSGVWSYAYDSSAAAEGAKTLHLKATDNAGNEAAAATRDFGIDTNDPTLTGLSLDGIAYTVSTYRKAGSMTISGTAADTRAVDHVVVEEKAAGASSYSVAATLTAADQSLPFAWTWTRSFDAGDAVGQYYYRIVAYDASGHAHTSSTDANLTFLLDTTAPSVSFTAVTPIIDPAYDGSDNLLSGKVNGTVTIKGTASDANPLASVAYRFGGILADDTGYTAFTGNLGSWTIVKDTTSMAEDVATTLFIRARDGAGNETISTIDLTADQDTDKPIIRLQSIDPANVPASAAPADIAAAAKLNRMDAAAFALSIEDDDGIAANALQLSFSSDGSTWSAWTAAAHTAATGGVAKTVNYTLGGASLAEGAALYVKARVADTGGVYGTSFTDGADALHADAVYWVDLSAPTIDFASVDGVAYAGGTLYRNASFTLFGSVSDGSALSSVQYSLDGTNWTAVDAFANGGAWSRALSQTITGVYLRASDEFAKTATTTRIPVSVVYDVAPPAVSAASPAASSWQRGTVALSGDATDSGGSGVASVVWAVTVKGVDPVAGDWHAAALGAGTWTASFDAAAAGVSEGLKTLHLIATDNAGNASSDAAVDFGVDKADPTLSGLQLDAVAYSSLIYRSGGSVVVSGTAADSYSLASVVVEEKTPGGSWAPAATVAVSGTSSSWNWTKTFGGTDAEGQYDYRIVAWDTAGNPHTSSTAATASIYLDRSAPSAPTIAAPNSGGYYGESTTILSGSAADGGSGVASVEWSSDGGTTWTAASGTTSWTYTLDISQSSALPNLASQGSKTVRARATDKAGNVSASASVSFWIDRAAPEGSFDSPAAGIRVNGAADLAVVLSASDFNGVSAVDLKAGTNDFASPDASAVLNGGTGKWEASIPAAAIAALASGTRRIYARVRDVPGRTTVIDLQINVDKDPPTVAISSPADGSIVNGSIAVSGTASDLQVLSSVSLDVWSVASADWEAVSGVSGSANWELASFNTLAAAYGSANYDRDAGTAGTQLRLRATAHDEAGNTASALADIVIDQDSDRPIIALSNIDPEGSTILKMSRTVYGTVTDDDGTILSANFRVSEDGSTWVAPTTYSSGTWSYSASSGDGSKKIYFRVADAKGAVFATDAALEPRIQNGAGYWETYVDFSVDTVPPEIYPSIYADKISPYTFTDGIAITSNMPFGGPGSVFAVKVSARDASGIASVVVSVPGIGDLPASLIGAEPADTSYTAYGTASFDVGSLPDGPVSITVSVTDVSGLISSASRTILVDNTAPVLSFLDPATASVVNGEVTVTGTASDASSGLQSAAYRVGKNYASESSVAPDGSAYLWEIPFTGSNSLSVLNYANSTESYVDSSTGVDLYILPVVVYATDKAGNVRSTEPIAGTATRPSATTFRAAALAGDSRIAAGQVALIGSEARVISAWDSATGTATWSGTVSTAETAYTILEYSLRINPDGDSPTASISYPETGATLGGTVRIYGTAADDDGVASVWMQIDTDGDGSFTAADDAIGGWYNGGSGLQVTGSANWNQTINESGEFDPTGAEPKRLYLRVRSQDIYGTLGPWSNAIEILIDKNVPLIGSAYALMLDPDADPGNGNEIPYTYGMYIKGNWYLRGSIEDETALASVALSGDLSGTLASKPSWFTLTTSADAPHETKYKRIDLNVPISCPADTALTWNFTITASDVSEPARVSAQALRLNIDTKAPTATLNATATPALVQQSNGWYKVKGTAVDDGSDVDRVEVYFVRTGSDRLYNPALPNSYLGTADVTFVDGSPVKAGTADSRTTTSLTDAALIGNPLVAVGQKIMIGGEDRTVSAWNSASGYVAWADGEVAISATSYVLHLAISIDHKDIIESWSGSSVVNDDSDGYVEYLKQDSGTTYTWFVDIKSDNIPDGPIDIHYVVFDSSGNATAYQTTGYKIQNNGPRVAAVWVGTDLDLSGAVDETEGSAERELFAYSSATTDNLSVSTSFKVKETPMYILPVVTNGNGDLSLVLGAGTSAASLSGILAGHVLRVGDAGALVPIELDSTVLDGIGEGDRTFRFTVWDSTEETTQFVDSLSMTRDFVCTIERVDTVVPSAAIAPFHWNSSTDNSLYGASAANGHIEITGVYDGDDPDVSGRIVIRGTARDDQRLTAIWVHIDGFGFPASAESRATFDIDGDGTAETLTDTYHRVATFASPGAGQPYAWTAIDQWSLNGWKMAVTPVAFDQNGHEVEWELSWDSAKVSGVAAANRNIRVIAEDKRTNPNASAESAAQTASGSETPLYTVDVVPYIDKVATTINSLVLADFNRSALGRYPVQTGQTVTVGGFNLAPATLSGASSDVRLSIDPDAFDAAYAVKQGTGLASSAANADNTSLTVTVGATGSGYLTVISNGVPSINNIDSTAAYNAEASSVHQSVFDDRFFSVWSLTTLRTNASAPLAANAVYPSMVVNGTTPQFAYVNNSGGYGLAEFWNGTSEIEMYENWDLFTFSNLALNDAGARAALFDINIVQSGTNFIGDKGGITVNMFYDPPNTTWSGTTYYYRDNNLWLDNLYHASTLAVLDRYRYPDIKLVGTNALTNAYYGVYDSIDDKVIFRYFRVGTNQTTVGGGTAANASRINDTGTALYVNNQDLVQRNQNNTWPTYTDNATNNTRIGQNNNSGNTNAGQTIATGAGEHVAVEGTSGGVALIAYYRTSDNKLVYQYNTSPTGAVWSTPVVIDADIGAEYIDMVVDSADRIHIAYYDSFNGNVKYAFFDSYSDTTPDVVTVDSYLSIGSKLSLSLNSANVPHIAYRGIGNTAKIAWLAGSLGDGVDADEKLNKAWEVQVLPNRIIDSDSNRFNVGVGTDGRAVVGYSNAQSGAKGIEYLTALADLAN